MKKTRPISKTKKAGAKKKLGRPTIYTQKLGKEICRRLVEGESLKSICEDKSMPNRDTVFGWIMDENHEFSDKYARAREVQAEFIADEVLEISDASAVSAGEENGSAHVQAAKLRTDSRKWVLSKLLPKKYGERQSVELTGKNGGPLQSQIVATLSPEQEALVRKIAETRASLTEPGKETDFKQ